MDRAYEDVKSRVSEVVPLYLKHNKKDDLYEYLLYSFWREVGGAVNLFDAAIRVQRRYKSLFQNTELRSKQLTVAYQDMMEILKSTKKYYGVSQDMLYKHDLVLQ